MSPWTLVVIITISTIVSISLVIFFVISYLRALKPHSKRMIEEQIQLRKKAGETPTAPTVPTDADGTGRSFLWLKTGSKLFWSLFLTLAGAAVLYFGVYTQSWKSPHPVEIGSWSWEHWPPLLILWGIITTLIGINAKEETVVKLRKVLTLTMLTVLVLFPAWRWVATPSTPLLTPTTSARSEVPVGIQGPTAWQQMIIPAYGRSAVIRRPSYAHMEADGDGFLTHNVYAGGHDCAFGQPCPEGPTGNYIENKKAEMIVVSYRFVPD